MPHKLSGIDRDHSNFALIASRMVKCEQLVRIPVVQTLGCIHLCSQECSIYNRVRSESIS